MNKPTTEYPVLLSKKLEDINTCLQIDRTAIVALQDSVAGLRNVINSEAVRQDNRAAKLSTIDEVNSRLSALESQNCQAVRLIGELSSKLGKRISCIENQIYAKHPDKSTITQGVIVKQTVEDLVEQQGPILNTSEKSRYGIDAVVLGFDTTETTVTLRLKWMPRVSIGQRGYLSMLPVFDGALPYEYEAKPKTQS